MNTITDNKVIAQTILDQLGGKRFIAMTGAKSMSYGDNRLNMRLPRCKDGITSLSITLELDDTYTMTFHKTVPVFRTVKELVGVYCDGLQQAFEMVTGLRTSL